MKRLFCVVLAFVLILTLVTACAANKAGDTGLKTPSEDPETPPETGDPPERAASGVRIGFITQEYIGDNIAEIPYIEYEGERSEAIESINRSLNQGEQSMYEDFINSADSDREWIEIKSYPFTTERFLQVVVTTNVFPNYATDGNLFSINYDIEMDEWISVDYALGMEGLDYDTLLYEVGQHFVPEVPGQLIEEVKVAGFLIEDGSDGLFVQFLLEITTDGSDSDPLISFYSYTPHYNSFHALNAYCLFDPYNMDQMDPPLSYQKNAQ